jgi:hypothetical protein
VTWKRPTPGGRAVVARRSRCRRAPLVAAGAERQRALAGEDDHADVGVLAREVERVGQLDERLGRKALRTSGRSIVILAMRGSGGRPHTSGTTAAPQVAVS